MTVQSRKIVKTDGEEIETVLTDEFEEVSVQKYETDVAYVTASAGVTKALRQYESLRVDARCSLPCYVEQMDDTYEFAAEWVANRLYEEVDKYFGEEGEDGAE
jgi:hypothetical protein